MPFKIYFKERTFFMVINEKIKNELSILDQNISSIIDKQSLTDLIS